MAVYYLSSDAVKVYPTALRGTDYRPGDTIYDPESRLGTEFNLTNAVNRLTIDGSFVISKVGNVLEFSIHGYYFKVSSVSTLTTNFASDSHIYATIRLRELAQQNYHLLSLVPVEDGTSTNLDVQGTGFVGVGFGTTDEGDGTNTFSLEILRKVNNTWVVPDTSLLKFDAEDIMIDVSKNNSAISLHDVLYKDNNGKVNIESDEFVGHLTGNVTGNLDGNAKTATDSDYSTKVGTSTNHPAIGSNVNPVYVNSDGVIVRSSGTSVGSYNQPVYFNNGTITKAFKIEVSNQSPTSTEGFNEGDIWLQYLG